MRYDTRYSRVYGLITDPVIPRTRSAGIALCHGCQRQVYFAGGYMRMLTQAVEQAARAAHFRRMKGDPEYRAQYILKRKGK